MDKVVRACIDKFGESVVSSGEVYAFLKSTGLGASFTPIIEYKVSRGKFQFTKIETSEISDDELSKRISSRFTTLRRMTEGSASGIVRSMIVTGPGGLGKSHTVSEVINSLPEERVKHIRGYIRPTGLYKTLYENRFKKNVIVFDDADSIFADETSLNLLKAACDSTDKRRLSWMSMAEFYDEGGDLIPNSFDFEGCVIFITNKDLQSEVDRSGKLAPHFEAMISRSHYIDLGIKTPRDYIIRIKQVIESGMLSEMPNELKDDIIKFIEDNQTKMRELSLRMVLKIADLASIDPKGWKEMATVTCMKV